MATSTELALPATQHAAVTIQNVFCDPSNTGHCLHDQLMHAWFFTRQHPNVVSWTTPWADACKTWQCEALRLAARSLAINLTFSGRAHGCFNLRNCSLEPRNATKDTTDGRVFVASTTGSLDFLDALTWSKRSRFAEGRKMRDISVLYTLRRFAWHFVGVDHSRGDVRLYTRGDALLRRLLGWERFATHFDTVHTSMNIPFAEQVRAFAGARVFVSPCGAHTTNIMFMHSTATMVDVQIHAQNSWQVSMGDSKLIRRYIRGNKPYI